MNRDSRKPNWRLAAASVAAAAVLGMGTLAQGQFAADGANTPASEPGLDALGLLQPPALNGPAADAGAPPPAPGVAAPAVPGAKAADQDMAEEVLTSAPIHEAFANPTALNPAPGLIAPKQAPANIEELPPEQKPEGKNVEWIPGYWAWDDERNDYIWISGIWRDAPPGRRWVPGYWGQVAKGWQWTPGFWAANEQEDVEYQPEPPASLEVGPSAEAPSENHFWVPGCWVYRDVRYVWRPGYWWTANPDWVWIPHYYSWTPRGYVLCGGYWDLLPNTRGVLFAPVYYRRPLYVNVGYRWTPSICFDVGGLSLHLFARPNYCHYYYGNYYDPWAARSGIVFWANYHRSRGCYDPLYSYHRWHHVNHLHERNWEVNIQTNYNSFVTNVNVRPTRTYNDIVALRGQRGKLNDAQLASLQVARPLNDYVKDGKFSTKFRDVDMKRREEFVKHGRDFNKLAAARIDAETKDGGRPRGPGDRAGDRPNGGRPDGGRADSGRPDGNRPVIGADGKPDRQPGDRSYGKFRLPKVDGQVSTGGAGATSGGLAGGRDTGGPRGDGGRTRPRPNDGDKAGPAAGPNTGPNTGATAGDRPAAGRPDRVRPNRPNTGDKATSADQPANGNTAGDGAKPNNERPSRERPNVERPSAERPKVERPNVERPERPNVERPERGERPANRPQRPEGSEPSRPRPERPERPSRPRDRASAEVDSATGPADVKPARTRPSGERPVGERPANERPPAARPAVERSNVERPKADIPRPARDEPRVERPQPRAERSPPPRAEREAPPRVERSQTPPRVERPQAPPRQEVQQPPRRDIQRPVPSGPSNQGQDNGGRRDRRKN